MEGKLAAAMGRVAELADNTLAVVGSAAAAVAAMATPMPVSVPDVGAAAGVALAKVASIAGVSTLEQSVE